MRMDRTQLNIGQYALVNLKRREKKYVWWEIFCIERKKKKGIAATY
jgi:hypothetical protein